MRFLLLFAALLAAQFSFAQVSGTDYKLYDSRLMKEVSVDEIAAKMEAGTVLVFGEQHDDSIGHLMEQKVLEALYATHGSNVVLSMEMFHRDVQYIVDEYLQGIISEKNFIKESRAWDTYKTDYRPSVEFAKAKGLSVIAANTPSRYANLVTRKGLDALSGLSKTVKKNYLPPLPVDTLTGKYYEGFLEAMGGHSMPGMNLYQSQNLWDATMSWSIAQGLKQHKKAIVFMMNGRFHSDHHLGFVKRLEDDYKKKVTNISCFAAEDFAQPAWSKYAAQGDYILITQPKEKPAETK